MASPTASVTAVISVFVTIAPRLWVSGYDVSSAPRCSDPLLENPGYSSTRRQGVTIWSHCGFPNPKLSATRCGRTLNGTVTYDLCDPDNVFTSIEQAEIDSFLWSAEQTTPYQCTPWHGAVLNYTIIIVAVKHIRVPDLTGNNTCMNGCGELLPELDVFSRKPTEEEKQAAIDSFGRGLVSSYKGYFCDNFVVIVFWKNKTKISTSTSSRMASLISPGVISEAEHVAISMINSSNVENGFRLIVEKYRKLILGFTPAYILLVGYVVLLFLVAIFLLVQFGFGNKGGYFDDEMWKNVIRVTLKMLFGIWFIEMLLIGLVRIQDRMKPWVIILPLIGCIAAAVVAIVIYVTEKRAGSTQ